MPKSAIAVIVVAAVCACMLLSYLAWRHGLRAGLQAWGGGKKGEEATAAPPLRLRGDLLWLALREQLAAENEARRVAEQALRERTERMGDGKEGEGRGVVEGLEMLDAQHRERTAAVSVP